MLLAVAHMESARLEFPLVAGLGVLIFVEAGTGPFEILLGVAQFDVASAGRASAALEVDDVIMDIGAREHVTRGQGRIHLQQLGAARGFVLALAAHHDERAVVGEEIDEAGDVAAPYAIAIALRQLADSLAIREFGQRLFDAFRHEYFLLEGSLRSYGSLYGALNRHSRCSETRMLGRRRFFHSVPRAASKSAILNPLQHSLGLKKHLVIPKSLVSMLSQKITGRFVLFHLERSEHFVLLAASLQDTRRAGLRTQRAPLARG